MSELSKEFNLKYYKMLSDGWKQHIKCQNNICNTCGITAEQAKKELENINKILYKLENE